MFKCLIRNQATNCAFLWQVSDKGVPTTPARTSTCAVTVTITPVNDYSPIFGTPTPSPSPVCSITYCTTHTRIYTFTSTHTHAHTCTYARPRTYIHVHIHTHTHMHIHSHTNVCCVSYVEFVCLSNL